MHSAWTSAPRRAGELPGYREKRQKDLDSWYHTSMSAYQTDSRIDDYITTLPGWQQELCRQVRELVHAADPEVTETIKRTRQPYFTLQGNICALLGAKDHLTIFIYDPIVPDPEGLINQGHGNRTARAIQVREARNHQPARPVEPLSSHYRQ